jgi:leader peptidase (prepilin peptidase) / N-methyltransferase
VLADLEPLATTPGAYVFVVVLGLLWGSFANVCIYRWPPSEEFPKGRSVVAPGSHCFACKTPIRWYDNVPLLSWLWLRGKCRSCKAPFSARYLIVEVLLGALFGVAWWMAVVPGSLTAPFSMQLARFGVYAAFCFVMVVVTFIDIDTKLILDKVTIPSIILFYGLGLALGRHWSMGLIGIALGYGLPWVVGEIYFIVTERDGLGLGDSMLLAMVGALLGWRGVLVSLFLGAITGSVIGTLALLRAPATETAAATPPRSRASSFVAIGAVGATITATATALTGNILAAGIACGVALVCLVVSRRLEPPLPDEPVPATEASNEPEPSRVPALLAAISALLFIAGAGAVILASAPVAIALAAAGGIALFFARRQFAAQWSEEPSSPPEADASLTTDDSPDGPSLLRTELPFGPFLALGAVFYLFAESWLVVQFRFVGG